MFSTMTEDKGIYRYSLVVIDEVNGILNVYSSISEPNAAYTVNPFKMNVLLYFISLTIFMAFNFL